MPCCGQVVCNREDEYQMFSYSREFCDRSHRRYTTCGKHDSERHSGDWRECKICVDELRNPGDFDDSTDNAFAGPMRIGFPFYFNGVRYDSFYVSTNMLITLSNRR